MRQAVYINGLGKRLRDLRLERDMSSKEVSKQTGFLPDQIYRYENGDINPLTSNLLVLAMFYNVSTDYLLGLSDNKINTSSKEVDKFVKELNRLSETQKNLLLEFLEAL